VLLPLTGLAMVALPALDAHTRELLGRSLAYEVTEKQPAWRYASHGEVVERRGARLTSYARDAV